MSTVPSIAWMPQATERIPLLLEQAGVTVSVAGQILAGIARIFYHAQYSTSESRSTMELW